MDGDYYSGGSTTAILPGRQRPVLLLDAGDPFLNVNTLGFQLRQPLPAADDLFLVERQALFVSGSIGILIMFSTTGA